MELRGYYAENLNLKNDTTIALAMSSRALINIDEFDKYTRSQHPLLKFLISQSDVDMRLPFAAHIEQRRRFASFIATTNSTHPLVDSTGSRRYVCVHVTGAIDFLSPIDYPQLYAQLVEEVQSGLPFWLNEEQTAQLMQQNDQFQEIDGLEQMVTAVFKRPEKVEEGLAMTMPEIVEVVQKRFPGFKIGQNTFREVGRILAKIGIDIKHTREGNVRFVSLK
jgi:predicted P-loop ATPase